MAQRIEFNVQTGERKVVTMTLRELAAYAPGAAEEEAQRQNRPPNFEERLRACEKALGL